VAWSLREFSQPSPSPERKQSSRRFCKTRCRWLSRSRGSIAWFAIKIDDHTYGIFDVFDDDAGRQGHLNGPIAAALVAKADELLAEPPSLKLIDITAEKLPG
jgi:hypothetical protein